MVVLHDALCEVKRGLLPEPVYSEYFDNIFLGRSCLWKLRVFFLPFAVASFTFKFLVYVVVVISERFEVTDLLGTT